jgi:predicted ATPase
VRLFTERAQNVLSVFQLSESNIEPVSQICRRLDGIPLAIELAAARINILSVEQIASRLDDRFNLLTSGKRTGLPHQQTLRAEIDWSYQLLSESEQAFFRRCSVFSGSWTLDAAEAICSAEAGCINLLGSLVDKSLVVVDQHGDEPRYHSMKG